MTIFKTVPRLGAKQIPASLLSKAFKKLSWFLIMKSYKTFNNSSESC